MWHEKISCFSAIRARPVWRCGFVFAMPYGFAGYEAILMVGNNRLSLDPSMPCAGCCCAREVQYSRRFPATAAIVEVVVVATFTVLLLLLTLLPLSARGMLLQCLSQMKRDLSLVLGYNLG